MIIRNFGKHNVQVLKRSSKKLLWFSLILGKSSEMFQNIRTTSQNPQDTLTD